jgi:hypothetical protein
MPLSACAADLIAIDDNAIAKDNLEQIIGFERRIA